VGGQRRTVPSLATSHAEINWLTRAIVYRKKRRSQAVDEESDGESDEESGEESGEER
jgi:hypothetical protein